MCMPHGIHDWVLLCLLCYGRGSIPKSPVSIQYYWQSIIDNRIESNRESYNRESRITVFPAGAVNSIYTYGACCLLFIMPHTVDLRPQTTYFVLVVDSSASILPYRNVTPHG